MQFLNKIYLYQPVFHLPEKLIYSLLQLKTPGLNFVIDIGVNKTLEHLLQNEHNLQFGCFLSKNRLIYIYIYTVLKLIHFQTSYRTFWAHIQCLHHFLAKQMKCLFDLVMLMMFIFSFNYALSKEQWVQCIAQLNQYSRFYVRKENLYISVLFQALIVYNMCVYVYTYRTY